MTKCYIKRQYTREVKGAPLEHHTGIYGYRADFWQGDGRASLDVDGTLSLGNGFGFDGATGVPDTKRNLRAAGLHDALIGMIMCELLPFRLIWAANRVFFDRMIIDGEPRAIAFALRIGTDIFTGPWTLAAIAFGRAKGLFFGKSLKK